MAITGTGDLQGHVGQVGGIEAKAHAALSRGINYFFMPHANTEPIAQQHNTGKVEVFSNMMTLICRALDLPLSRVDNQGGGIARSKVR